MGWAQRQDHEALHVLCISHEKLSGFRCSARSRGLWRRRHCPESCSARGKGGRWGWPRGCSVLRGCEQSLYSSRCFVPSRLLTEARCSVVVTQANLGTVLNCLRFSPPCAAATLGWEQRVPSPPCPRSLVKFGACLGPGWDRPKGCHGDVCAPRAPCRCRGTSGIKTGYGHSSGAKRRTPCCVSGL